MSEENTSQKEQFLQEVERKLLRKELDARLLEDGLIYVSWNEKPLCSVDRDGIVRFRPADITGLEVDRQLRTVISQFGVCLRQRHELFGARHQGRPRTKLRHDCEKILRLPRFRDRSAQPDALGREQSADAD